MLGIFLAHPALCNLYCLIMLRNIIASVGQNFSSAMMKALIKGSFLSGHALMQLLSVQFLCLLDINAEPSELIHECQMRNQVLSGCAQIINRCCYHRETCVWITRNVLVKVTSFTMEQIEIGWSGLCCDVQRCCMLMSSKCDKAFYRSFVINFWWSLDWMNETCSGSWIKVKHTWLWAVWFGLFRLKLSKFIVKILSEKEVIDYYYYYCCKLKAFNYS